MVDLGWDFCLQLHGGGHCQGWVVGVDNKFRFAIFPFVFCLVLEKNKEENVVGKTKIHLLLLTGFVL